MANVVDFKHVGKFHIVVHLLLDLFVLRKAGKHLPVILLMQ